MSRNCSFRLSLIKHQADCWFHRAKWVMTDPDTIMENGCVETRGRTIARIFPWSSMNKSKAGANQDSIIDHGDTLLMPVFINAHCHLELSALHNGLPLGQGFTSWVKKLLEKRQALGHDALFDAAQFQAEHLAEHGTGFIADISTLGITRSFFENDVLAGIWFQECLGSHIPDAADPDTADCVQNNLASFSLAGHAPHTTAPELLKTMKEYTRKRHLLFSIHAGESEEEEDFLRGQTGKWKDFLESRGIDTDSWPVGARSCVDYLDRLGLLDEQTLAVHLIRADARDMERLFQTRTRLCLCPRSNFALHGMLPDISLMLDKGLAPALGTDSLASCDSLDMADEMGFVHEHFPQISPAKIVKMATENGAKALHLDHITGKLAPGRLAWFLDVPVRAAHARQIPERLVSHEW